MESGDFYEEEEVAKKPMDILSCPVCSNKFLMDPKELRVIRGDEPDINEEVGVRVCVCMYVYLCMCLLVGGVVG